MTTGDAIETVLRALRDIHETIPRCSRCENYLTVVAQARLALDRLDATADAASDEVAAAREQVAAAREQLDAWIAEAEDRVRTTNNCEVCVPRGPYERFIEALSRGRD